MDAFDALLRGESFFLKSSPVTPVSKSEREQTVTIDDSAENDAPLD